VGSLRGDAVGSADHDSPCVGSPPAVRGDGPVSRVTAVYCLPRSVPAVCSVRLPRILRCLPAAYPRPLWCLPPVSPMGIGVFIDDPAPLMVRETGLAYATVGGPFSISAIMTCDAG